MSLYKHQFEILLAKNFKVILRKRMIWFMNLVLPILVSTLLLVARRYITEDYVPGVYNYRSLETNNFFNIT